MEALKHVFIVCVLIGIGVGVFGQSGADKTAFFHYLLQNNLDEDASTFLKQMPIRNKYEEDSVNFYLGLVNWKINADTSHYFFTQVSPQNKEWFMGANTYLAHVAFFQKEFDKTLFYLNRFNNAEARENCILSRMRIGARVLTTDSLNHLLDHPCLKNAEELVDLRDLRTKYQKKSPFLAGLYSALIPGLGRVYAEKPTQGIISFLPIAMLGIQAYEGYVKSGINSPRFIVYSTVFSIFYIGNIWGSTLAVKAKQNEINNRIHYEIVALLQFPMSVFTGNWKKQ